MIAQHSFHAQKKGQARGNLAIAPYADLIRKWMYAIRLSVLWINRSCKPANPAFTMSNIPRTPCITHGIRSSCFRRICMACQPKLRQAVSSPPCAKASEDNLRCCAAQVGGASRDRTGDLKLAKLALSQLSYGPDELQLACQPKLAGVSPALLRLRLRRAAFPRFASEGWWARDELNVRPHAYQACALTT